MIQELEFMEDTCLGGLVTKESMVFTRVETRHERLLRLSNYCADVVAVGMEKGETIDWLAEAADALAEAAAIVRAAASIVFEA